jgi:hypothetical protein
MRTFYQEAMVRRSFSGSLCLVALVAIFTARIASAADQVENPAYKGWKNFKVGSWARLEGAMEGGPAAAGGNQVSMTMTHKLIELTPEKAVVETTVVMKMMGREMARPGRKHDVPAMVDADKADLGDLSQNPQLSEAKKEVKKGEEELDVLGKKMKCNWVDVTVTQAERTVNVKVWHAGDIPGGIVQSTTKSGPMSNTMKLTEFEAAK